MYKSLILLVLIAFYQNNSVSQSNIEFAISEKDSLSQLLEELNGKNKFPILLELAEITRHTDPNLAVTYIERASEWVDENDINKDLFQYYKKSSAVKLSQHLYREVITFADKAIQFNLQDINTIDYIDLYEYKGKANYHLGEHDIAQQVLFKALNIADSLQLDEKVAAITNTIGAVYLGMDDEAMSEKYYLLAIEKAKKGDHQQVLIKALANLAFFYADAKKYKEAENLILEIIDRAEERGDKQGLGANYNNLAVTYQMQKKYELSIVYFKKALIIAEELNNLHDISLSHCNLGELYTDINNYILAEQHLEIGLRITKEIDNRTMYAHTLLTTAGLFEKTGKFKKALDYFKQYSSLTDSLLNEKRIQIVGELEGKYEAEKKELEIKSLSIENSKAHNKIDLFRYMIFGLFAGLLGFVAFIYFITQNHKKNLIIQNKNLKIASDKIDLLEKSKEITKLSSLIKGQEYERERLAKELHDGLGGLLAISHSKLANLSAKTEINHVAFEESKILVGEAYDQVRQISHNLMPLDLEKFGLVTTLKNMIGMINSPNENNIDFRTYNFDLALNNYIGLNIYRIVQECVTNILKYAEAKNVLIELIQHEQYISLSIEDNGSGFDLLNFNSGNGIQNMRNRSELLNGSFDLESNVGEGTSISVLLPRADKSIS